MVYLVKAKNRVVETFIDYQSAKDWVDKHLKDYLPKGLWLEIEYYNDDEINRWWF